MTQLTGVIVKEILSTKVLFGLLLFLLTAASTAQEDSNKETLKAVERSHLKLWKEFVDKHGLILDFVGDIPTAEDCSLGRPNAIGWWSPIENGPMFTGLYLPAACERARRTGDQTDTSNAKRLVNGLLKCASVSEVPGMIVRGVGTDGVCHYPLGSDDQTHPWFYGLHAYVTSGLPSPDERRQAVEKMKEVADVLEKNNWNCPCDGAFKGQNRGGFQGHLFRDAVRYLFLLRVMYDVTQDTAWLDRYKKALSERPKGCDKTRAEICAAGYPPDREAIKNLDETQLWIYVGCQGSLAKLVALETNESLRAQYKTGLSINASNALSVLNAYAKFDNNDKQLFGNADWRQGYPTWFPQLTQSDALKLAQTGDKTKLGGRKNYESRYMRNPLAAAAIVAFEGDTKNRELVERVIRHYDYGKLNMSAFFFAECAYYSGTL